MKNDQLEEELIFYPSKLKNILLVIVSIIFIVMAVDMLFEKKNYFLNLSIILLFGLGGIVTIKQIFLNKSYLKINKEGFEYSLDGKLTFIKWQNIEKFKFINIRMITLIGWLYSPETKKTDILSKTSRTSRTITGIDDLLPDTYSLNSNELMNILVKYWSNYRNQ